MFGSDADASGDADRRSGHIGLFQADIVAGVRVAAQAGVCLHHLGRVAVPAGGAEAAAGRHQSRCRIGRGRSIGHQIPLLHPVVSQLAALSESVGRVKIDDGHIVADDAAGAGTGTIAQHVDLITVGRADKEIKEVVGIGV